MPTEALHAGATGSRRGRLALLALAGLAVPFAVADPAAAQDEGPVEERLLPESGPSLLLVDVLTEVSSVGFRFLNGSAVSTSRLRANVATRGGGTLASLQEALDFLPLVSDPELPSFSPLSLQKDVVRLRRLFERAGYPDAKVDYEVALDTAENAVQVDFVIDQGQPVVLGDIETRWGGAEAEPAPETTAPPLAPELEPEWRRLLESLSRERGRTFGEQQLAALEARASEWLLQRGYPWARARVEPTDTTDRVVEASLTVTPGPRARVDGIVFEGQERLDRWVLEREVPIEPGAWYDERGVIEGETELYELELVTRALGGIVPGQPRDSTVTLRFRIEESDPRLLWGRVGWRSESGFGGEAHWTHRDFFGEARTFTVSSLIETGWAATEPARGLNGGLSATVRQPYLVHRQVSATFGPFVQYRNDFRDRSWLYGLQTAVIYRPSPLRTLTLQHELSRLQVVDAFELAPIGEIVARGPSDFSPTFVRSVFKLHGTFGSLDDRLDPRAGFAVEPSVEVTGPLGISDVEFFRMSVEGLGAIPLSDRFGLFLRGSAGRLFPFGASDPDDDAISSRAIVGLRSVMYTAGGTADVRGWGTGLVGPKIPDVELGPGGTLSADRYAPVGGLGRLTGSVELGLPFPFFSDVVRSFVFLDAGRVWSPGDQLQPGDEPLALEPWAYGTGGGIQISSPFGPIRLAVGYKLNPTRIDLLPPGDVARALAAGEGLSGLATESGRRWHLHLTIGQTL